MRSVFAESEVLKDEEQKIEKAHRILSNGLDNAPSEHEWCLAFKMAIDTLCKYQKIAMIIRKYDVTWEFHHMKPTIDEIREVIEDGNDT